MDDYHAMLSSYQRTPFTDCQPLAAKTGPALERLAAPGPVRLLIMHGAVYEGNGAQALREAADVIRTVQSFSPAP